MVSVVIIGVFDDFAADGVHIDLVFHRVLVESAFVFHFPVFRVQFHLMESDIGNAEPELAGGNLLGALPADQVTKETYQIILPEDI